MTGIFQVVCYEDSGCKKASTYTVNMAQSLKKLQKSETSLMLNYFPAEKGI